MKNIFIIFGLFLFSISNLYATERPLTNFARMQIEATNKTISDKSNLGFTSKTRISKDLKLFDNNDILVKNWYMNKALPLPNTIEENDFVRRVLKRNPMIHMLENNIRASFWELPQAIGIQTIIQKYTSFLEKAVGIPKLRSLFPSPGVFSLKSLISLQSRVVGKAKYLLGCSDIAFKSRVILAKILYFRKLSTVLSEEAKLIQELLDMANSRYQNGGSNFSDLMQMKAEKAIVFDALKEAKNNLETIEKTAWHLLNADDKQIFPNNIRMAKYHSNGELAELKRLTEHPEVVILNSLKKKLEFSIQAIAKMQLTDGSSLNSLPLSYSGQYRAKSKSPYMVKGAPTNFIDFAHATQQELITRRVSKDFSILNEIQKIKERLVLAKNAWIISKRHADVFQNTVIPKLMKAFNTIKSSYSSGNSTFEALILIEKQLIVAKKKILKSRLNEQIAGAKFCNVNGLVFPRKVEGK